MTHPRFGFTRIERSAVPPAIAATLEFRSACPASAIARPSRSPHRGISPRTPEPPVGPRSDDRGPPMSGDTPNTGAATPCPGPATPPVPSGSGVASGAITVRPASPADAAVIAAIYSEGIRGRGATFETAERTADDVRGWFAVAAVDAPTHPFLVAARDRGGGAEMVGWVRASDYRPRAVYRGITEFSVYVTRTARGQRVGDALMTAFLPACMAAGLWKLVSRIFPENAASRALCARHGYREVGTYAKHAQLDGVWRDVVIVERLLPENLT